MNPPAVAVWSTNAADPRPHEHEVNTDTTNNMHVTQHHYLSLWQRWAQGNKNRSGQHSLASIPFKLKGRERQTVEVFGQRVQRQIANSDLFGRSIRSCLDI